MTRRRGQRRVPVCRSFSSEGSRFAHLARVPDRFGRRRACPRVPNCIRLVPAKNRERTTRGNTTCPFAGFCASPLRTRTVGPLLTMEVVLPERWNRRAAASVLQASGLRSDVTVFRLNATAGCQSGSESALRRNTAERVYTIEAAHNPEVAGSNPAPATAKGPGDGAFLLQAWPAIGTPAAEVEDGNGGRLWTPNPGAHRIRASVSTSTHRVVVVLALSVAVALGAAACVA